MVCLIENKLLEIGRRYRKTVEIQFDSKSFSEEEIKDFLQYTISPKRDVKCFIEGKRIVSGRYPNIYYSGPSGSEKSCLERFKEQCYGVFEKPWLDPSIAAGFSVEGFSDSFLHMIKLENQIVYTDTLYSQVFKEAVRRGIVERDRRSVLTPGYKLKKGEVPQFPNLFLRPTPEVIRRLSEISQWEEASENSLDHIEF